MTKHESGQEGQGNFRSGVVYSRGPLVQGILRGILVPSLVLLCALAGYVWYRVHTARTPLQIIQTIHATQDPRERARALFDVSKILQGQKVVPDQAAIEQELRSIVAGAKSSTNPEADSELLRYVAFVAGLLPGESPFSMIEETSRSENSTVVEASLHAYGVRYSSWERHWKWVSQFLKHQNDHVKLTAVKILRKGVEREGFPSGIMETFTEVLNHPLAELRWNAALALGRKDIASSRKALEALMNTSSSAEGLEPGIREDLELQTLSLIQLTGATEWKDFLRQIVLQSNNMKVRKKAETILGETP